MLEKITSVEEFISSLKLLIKRLKKEDEIATIWFRGEDNVNILTPLVPKAYRIYNDPNEIESYTQAKMIEGNLKAEFIRHAQPYILSKGVNTSDWNYYFLMQHYGLKTRLLDWTESALTALFFSIENLNDNDSKVWLLNPHKLNKITTSEIHPENKGLTSLFCPETSNKSKLFDELNRWDINELSRKYLIMDFKLEHKEGLPFFPLAIMPTLLDDRMNMQQSCFTIFGNIVNGLLEIENHSEMLESIVIDHKYKRSIKEELRLLGITHRSIYPDLEGVSKSIADKYDIEHLVFKRIK